MQQYGVILLKSDRNHGVAIYNNKLNPIEKQWVIKTRGVYKSWC